MRVSVGRILSTNSQVFRLLQNINYALILGKVGTDKEDGATVVEANYPTLVPGVGLVAVWVGIREPGSRCWVFAVTIRLSAGRSAYLDVQLSTCHQGHER